MNKIDIFKNKKVLITGHSGFKGSWLATWLNVMGSEVFGLSLDVPTQPAHYDLLKGIFSGSSFIDISDTKKICKLVKKIEPDFLFHLAAQPIVLTAYSDPINTFKSNTLGTANILERLRLLENNCVAVIITSDKSYDNRELERGYVEDDLLGGKDPYSGSKGAAELVIRSYTESFFKVNNRNVKLAVGRAGNVIGGGDWATFRLIPDCVLNHDQPQYPRGNPHVEKLDKRNNT